jgi:beta-glucosidase
LCGDVNPSGKLPYTYPRYNGVIMHYDYKQSELLNANTWQNDFYNPQWDFGFGLSYTTFKYSNLTISKNKITSTDSLLVTVDVANTGDRQGKEVVQMYIRDHYASISPPLKKLKRFTKVKLKPLETQTIEFTINVDDLKFYGKENQWIAEDGEFTISINALSERFYLKN